MRKLVLLCGLFLGVVVPLPAQSVSTPWANKLFVPGIEKNPNQDPPEAITHSFGAVPKGTLCVKRFTFTNIYDVPIQIIDTNPGCSCLAVYPPERVLQPTESAEMTVTMDTRTLTGPSSRMLRVTVGPTYVSTAVFRFDVDSRADVMLTPGAINFGTVAQGQKESQTITIDYQGRQRDWRITGVVPTTGPIEITQVEQASRGILVGTKYYLSVTLKANAPAGPISEVITLKTNDPSFPLVQINVNGNVKAPLTLTPDRVIFPPTAVGQTQTAHVLVVGTDLFKIAPVPLDADGIAIETNPWAGPVQKLKVTFTPTKPGPLRKRIRLMTDMKDQPAVFLNVEGVGEPGKP